MSLNIEKKERLNPQTPLSPQQTDAGTVSSSKNPIDFTSEETKSKPKTMGIAVEKTTQEEPLTATTSVKENDKTQETPAEKTETTLVSKSSDEQVSTAETLTTSNKPKEQSELDKKLEEYSQKNNLANIDDVRASLISKQKEGTLTKSEEQLLTELDKPKKLISDEVLNSAEWKSKSQKEKINEYVKAYLEKFDDKFASKSKKEQEKQIKAQIKEFNEYINISNAVYSSAEIKNIATLAETLNSKNLEFNEFKTQGYKAFQNELVPLKTRQSEEWRNLSQKEKLDKYVEGYCSKKYENFENMSDADKKKCIDETIKEVSDKLGLSELLKGKSAEEAKEISEAIYTKAAIYFDAIDSNQLTIEQFIEMPVSEQSKLMLKYYKSKGIKEEAIINRQDTKIALAEEWEKAHPGEQATIKDVYNLLRKRNPKSLTNEEQILLKEYGILLKIDSKANKPISLQSKNSYLAILDGFKTSKEYISAQLQDISANNYSDKKTRARLQKLMVGCDNIEDLNFIINSLKEKNFKDDQIKKIIPQHLLSEYMAHSMATGNAEGYNIATGLNMLHGDVGVQKAATRIMPANFKGEALNKVATNTATYKELIDPLTQGLNDRKIISYQAAQACSHAVLTSASISSANKAVFAQDLVTNAKVNGSQEQLNFAKSMSQINDPAVTEGLAAASKSVDKSVRSQYNSYVESAAKNYPPAEQAKISNAMRTGEISQETLTKTTPSSTQAKDNTQTQNQVNNNQQASQKQGSKAQGAAQNVPTSTNLKNTTPTSGGRTSGIQTGSATVSTGTNSKSAHISAGSTGAVANNSTTNSRSSISRQNIDSVSATTGSVSGANLNTTSTASSKQVDETAKLEAKRDEVAQEALDTSNNIKESVAEHEKEKLIETALKQSVEEIAADEEFKATVEDKQIAELRNKLKNASNIKDVFDIISSLGENAQSVFFDRITKSKYLNSFIEHINDNSTLLKLYNSSATDAAKRIVLTKLGDAIYSLLENNKISDDNLSSIDYKIFKNYLTQNISSVNNAKFARFLKYLPLDEREKLTKLRNEVKGIDNQVPQSRIQRDVQPQLSQPAIQYDEPSLKENTPQPEQKSKVQQPQPQPKFEANETTKSLADGTIITRQGTAFGAISNVEDDSYRIVSPQELARQKGDPIGMNDEVLTPGSTEWQLKYNKQQAPQHTAFTMAALEDEEEDFGGTFGPAKVGMGKRINKKFPPKGFRFNA